MTLEEAIAAAETLKEHAPHCTLIAIGRFIPMQDIEREDDFKLSVLVNGTERKMITSDSDVQLILSMKKAKPAGMLF